MYRRGKRVDIIQGLPGSLTAKGNNSQHITKYAEFRKSIFSIMHNDYLLGMNCWRKPDILFLPFHNIEASKRDILFHIFKLIILILVN